MKRIFILCIVVISTAMFVSCKKDDVANNAANLSGDWKLISIDAAIKNTSQYTDDGVNYKTTTTTDYTTIDNTGTIKIEPSSMSCVNMAYSISTISHGQYFENNQLLDTLSFPFEYSVPAFNSTATYTNVGADSIHFSSGSLVFDQSGSAIPTNSSGMKYKLDGNKLKLFTNYSETKTEIQQDIQILSTNVAALTVNLEKN